MSNVDILGIHSCIHFISGNDSAFVSIQYELIDDLCWQIKPFLGFRTHMILDNDIHCRLAEV